MRKLKKLEKPCLMLLAVLVLGLAVAGPALADNATGGIKGAVDQYQSGGANAFTGEVDRIAGTVVGLVRGIAGIAAVIFLIWAGSAFWTAGGNPQALAQAKNQIIYFLVAVVLVMGAERIVGLLFSILGWGVQGT